MTRRIQPNPARIGIFLSLLGLVLVSRGVVAEEIVLPRSVFLDRLQGGWAGQMIGVSYGAPYEFKALGHTIDGPIRAWQPDFITNAINQDDLYVEMTFLQTLLEHGIDPTNEEVGAAFRDSQYRLWHANAAGRFNLKTGIMPPESGHPRFNPHSDDIDFQIEADLFGLITPGLFAANARLCDRFGRIMNHGDGLYGGQFVAAMYSQAYLEEGPSPDSIRRCLDAGLAAIPAESTYARLVRDVIAAHETNPDDWKAAWQVVEDTWAASDTCPDGLDKPFNIDAKVNGAYIVIGLLYGAGDFERTLEISTRCGQDADCNPSSAAGILGTLAGYKQIPTTYTANIPGLTGQKFEYTEFDVPGLLAACVEVTQKLVVAEGGRVEQRDGIDVLVLPAQRPAPPSSCEQLSDFNPSQLSQWRRDFQKRLDASDAPKP